MLSRQITMTTGWQKPSQGLCYGLTLQYPHSSCIWTFDSQLVMLFEEVVAQLEQVGLLVLTSLLPILCFLIWDVTKQPCHTPTAPHGLVHLDGLCPLKLRARINLHTPKLLLVRYWIALPSEAQGHLAAGSGSAARNQIWKFSFYSLGLQTLCSKKHPQSLGTPSCSILATINNQKQSLSHLTYINHPSGRGLSSTGSLFPR